MNPKKSEKGQVLVLVALSIVGLVGMTALAVDGGRIYSQRRFAQNAADNAAMAAALARCYGEPAVAAGLDTAADNGFNNDGVTNTVVVNNPPVDGAYAGENEYAEVLVSTTIQSALAQVVYSDELGTSARAVARCRLKYDYAVIALDTDNTVHGIHINGAGTFTIDGGGVISNSHHLTQSILIDGGSGLLSADPIHASGGITGDNFSTTPVPNVPPVTDPLADLPPPPVQPKPAQSTPDAAADCTTSGGHPGLSANYNGSGTIYLNPGMYCLIQGDANIDLVLNPGIYYIDGPGGFDAGGIGSLTGVGVMIYMSPNAGPTEMHGTSNVDLTACNSTATYTHQPDPPGGAVSPWCVGSYSQYEGMLFYADRDYFHDISMYGNTEWNAVGTIYAPSSFLNLHGNDTVHNLSSMLIANTILLGGTPTLNVDYDPGNNVQPPLSLMLVE